MKIKLNHTETFIYFIYNDLSIGTYKGKKTYLLDYELIVYVIKSNYFLGILYPEFMIGRILKLIN